MYMCVLQGVEYGSTMSYIMEWYSLHIVIHMLNMLARETKSWVLDVDPDTLDVFDMSKYAKNLGITDAVEFF